MITILKYITSSLLSFNSNFGDATFLMSQVSEENDRIQVVMPKSEIPNWFDYVSCDDIPIFWACQSFPLVALALEFGEVKENDEIKTDTSLISRSLPELMSDTSYIIDLHLFIEGQEISRKDFHYCSVGKCHVLMCDLGTFFNAAEEWKGLDACRDGWKTIQVQCESQLIINRWGVYVYKLKTNIDNIRFSCPYSTDDMPVPSSALVPKISLNHEIKHIQRIDVVETFGHYLNTLRSEQCASVANELLRWCRNTRGRPPSASVGGEASLMQEQEEFLWNLAQIYEMLGNVANHIFETKFQSTVQLVVGLLKTSSQHVKEKGHEVFHINMSMPIILEECERHPTVPSLNQKETKMGRQREWREAPIRRYWGSVELEEGDPIVWRIWKGKESVRERVSNIVILLKCKHCSLVEASSSNNAVSLEADYKDPLVQELLKRIEKDAMKLLNESQGKLKAYIVPMDVTVCDQYVMEMAIIRGQEILGRFGSNFIKTPYGKLRVDVNAKYSNINMQHETRMEHNVQNQKQHELKLESPNTNNDQSQNKIGWKKSLARCIGLSKCE